MNLEIPGEKVNLPPVRYFASKSPFFFSYKEKYTYFSAILLTVEETQCVPS